MITNKVQVMQDGKAPISCPSCGLLKTVPVSKVDKNKRPLLVGCKCGEKFQVFLEFRRQFRKPTDLEGYYVRKELFRDFDKPENKTKSPSANCRIKDISRDGVGFVRLSQQQVQEGNPVWLRFTLDDQKKSTIIREMVVTSVRGNTVGGRFVSRACGIEPELGFYLLES